MIFSLVLFPLATMVATQPRTSGRASASISDNDRRALVSRCLLGAWHAQVRRHLVGRRATAATAVAPERFGLVQLLERVARQRVRRRVLVQIRRPRVRRVQRWRG